VFHALLFVHVLLAIFAVGFNASYGVWIARAAREPEHLAYSLRGIKFIDDYLANPAYVLLLLTGLLMVRVGDVSLRQFWLVTALIVYGVLAVVGLAVYTPTLRDQIRALEAHGPESSDFQRLRARGGMVGGLLGVLAVAIVFFMVVKPTI
jgi:uncharacterized membrane protein